MPIKKLHPIEYGTSFVELALVGYFMVILENSAISSF